MRFHVPDCSRGLHAHPLMNLPGKNLSIHVSARFIIKVSRCVTLQCVLRNWKSLVKVLFFPSVGYWVCHLSTRQSPTPLISLHLLKQDLYNKYVISVAVKLQYVLYSWSRISVLKFFPTLVTFSFFLSSSFLFFITLWGAFSVYNPCPCVAILMAVSGN